MRYNDIINESSKTIEEVVDVIKNSKWFKNSKHDLYRGGRKSKNYVYRNITGDYRKPVDSNIVIHNDTNRLSQEKLGINIRNGYFCTQSLKTSSGYNDGTSMIFPMDDSVLYYSPVIRDFYNDIAYKYDPHDDNSELVNYVKSVTRLGYSTNTENEIMLFGGVYIIPVNIAAKYNLIKSEPYLKSRPDNLVNMLNDKEKISDIVLVLRNAPIVEYSSSDIGKIVTAFENNYDLLEERKAVISFLTILKARTENESIVLQSFSINSIGNVLNVIHAQLKERLNVINHYGVNKVSNVWIQHEYLSNNITVDIISNNLKVFLDCIPDNPNNAREYIEMLFDRGLTKILNDQYDANNNFNNNEIYKMVVRTIGKPLTDKYLKID